MAVLGLLLLLCAPGLTLDVVFQNTASINVDAVGQTFTLSSGWLFVAAVATGAVGLLGVTMLLGGIARARHRRAVLAESRGSAQDLQTDRDRLAAELDRERAGRTSTGSAPWPQRTAAAPDDTPATVNLARQEGGASSPPTDEREPVAAGRHGIFHRRDH